MIQLDYEKLNDHLKNVKEGASFSCPKCGNATTLDAKCNSCGEKLASTVWKYKFAFIEPLVGLAFGISAIVAFAMDISGFRSKTVELIFGFTENLFITSIILLVVIGFALKQFFVMPLIENLASTRLSALDLGVRVSKSSTNPLDTANCLVEAFRAPVALDCLPHEANAVATNLLADHAKNIPLETRQTLAELVLIDTFLNVLNNSWPKDRELHEAYESLASISSPMTDLATLLKSLDSSNNSPDQSLVELANATQSKNPQFASILLAVKQQEIVDSEAVAQAIPEAEIEGHVEDFRKEGWDEKDLDLLREILNSDKK